MLLFLRWLLSASAVLLSAYLIAGVEVNSFWSAMWISFFLGLLNVSIKPLLVLITLPVNIITLGLFTFVINATIILLTSSIIAGFTVSGFLPAILFGIVLSVIQFLLKKLAK